MSNKAPKINIGPAVRKTLAKFGLSDNEILVYTQALKHKETSPYALSRETGIPRTTVYDVLMTLALKDLVTLKQSDGISKQQTKIRAKNPSQMRRIIRERKDELSNLEVDIVDILPQLKEQYHQDEANANFKFYPGVEGARLVYQIEEQFTGKATYAFENLMPMDIFGREETNKLIRGTSMLRVEHDQPIHELITINEWTKHVLSYQVGHDENYVKARNIRYIENSIFDPKMRVVVQGSMTMMICAQDEEVWGLTINSQALSSTLAGIFQVLWQTAKPVTLELVKSWGENEFLKHELKKSTKKG